MTRWFQTSTVVTACLAAMALWAPPSHAAEFMPLGDLPGGLDRSEVLGISADGSTVVGKSNGGQNHPVRWDAQGVPTSLGSLSNSLTLGEALATNHDGSVVVGNSISDFSQGLEAFRWTEEEGIVALGFLWADEESMVGLDSQGTAVSADGEVVVGKSKPGANETTPPNSPGEGFMWTEEQGMFGLGDLPGGVWNSRAVAMSSDASIVSGFSVSTSGTNTFLWTEQGGMVQGVGLPGGATFSEARGMSADGSVIVGFASSSLSGGDSETCTGRPGGERPKVEAYFEDGVTSTALGDLPGGCVNGIAFDANADGSVIVGFSDTDVNDEAFIWDAENGMRNLREWLVDEHDLGEALTDWVLLEARAISDDGNTIAGTGLNPNGDSQGWVVRLPEPGAAAQGAFALLGVAALARLRGRAR